MRRINWFATVLVVVTLAWLILCVGCKAIKVEVTHKIVLETPNGDLDNQNPTVGISLPQSTIKTPSTGAPTSRPVRAVPSGIRVQPLPWLDN